jgi:hypothetical protein
MAALTALLLALMLLPAGVLAQPAQLAYADDVPAESFSFQVTVGTSGYGDGSLSFAVPTSGAVNPTGGVNPQMGKSYNWNISWGDGQSGSYTQADAVNALDSEGIVHAYDSSGTYTITITPNGSTDAWFGSFGFTVNSPGANLNTNKGKLTAILSGFTPLMTRTAAQIASPGSTQPSNEWRDAFSYCSRLTTTGPGFSSGWNDVTKMGSSFALQMFISDSNPSFSMHPDFNLPYNIDTVGDNFAMAMFSNCSGSAFTMNSVFNLPQGITTVGAGFATSMFSNCSGSAFTMNSVFNLPQGITTVGDSFAQNLFNSCSGSAFTMNSVFNLPQGITTVGDRFAYSMFGNCRGNSFQVNSVFKFPRLSQAELDKYLVLMNVFSNLPTTPATRQARTAYSIINNPSATPTVSPFTLVPSTSRMTFNAAFIDREYIAVNWGGLAKLPPALVFTDSPEYDIPDSVVGTAIIPIDVSSGASGGYPDRHSYFAMSLPEGITIDAATGIISGTPTAEAAAGTATVFVADPVGANTAIIIDYGVITRPQVGAPGSGDLDGDGIVTVAEAMQAAQAVVSGSGLSPAQIAIMDIDGDGLLTMADVILVIRIAAGL